LYKDDLEHKKPIREQLKKMDDQIIHIKTELEELAQRQFHFLELLLTIKEFLPISLKGISSPPFDSSNHPR